MVRGRIENGVEELMKTHKITEIARIYTFPNQETVIIEKPRKLLISASGNHRIQTEDNRLHIIPKGWIHIEIESEVGKWEL